MSSSTRYESVSLTDTEASRTLSLGKFIVNDILEGETFGFRGERSVADSYWSGFERYVEIQRIHQTFRDEENKGDEDTRRSTLGVRQSKAIWDLIRFFALFHMYGDPDETLPTRYATDRTGMTQMHVLLEHVIRQQWRAASYVVRLIMIQHNTTKVDEVFENVVDVEGTQRDETVGIDFKKLIILPRIQHILKHHINLSKTVLGTNSKTGGMKILYSDIDTFGNDGVDTCRAGNDCHDPVTEDEWKDLVFIRFEGINSSRAVWLGKGMIGLGTKDHYMKLYGDPSSSSSTASARGWESDGSDDDDDNVYIYELHTIDPAADEFSDYYYGSDDDDGHGTEYDVSSLYSDEYSSDGAITDDSNVTDLDKGGDALSE